MSSANAPVEASEHHDRARRILIVGCGGSGKSTLARRLGLRTGLPVIHLDAHYWRTGWNEMPAPEWAQTVARIIQSPTWIIDGNYGGTMLQRIDACDSVVFLDIPTHKCVFRVLKRRMQFAGRSRPDMGPGCKERLTWEFLMYILRYRTTRRHKILSILNNVRHNKHVAVLRTGAEIELFLKQFPTFPTHHDRNDTAHQ